MIRSKNNVEELLKNKNGFRYSREEMEQVSVNQRENQIISIIKDTPKCIYINRYNIDKAVSVLYKDRKYINKNIF